MLRSIKPGRWRKSRPPQRSFNFALSNSPRQNRQWNPHSIQVAHSESRPPTLTGNLTRNRDKRRMMISRIISTRMAVPHHLLAVKSRFLRLPRRQQPQPLRTMSTPPTSPILPCFRNISSHSSRPSVNATARLHDSVSFAHSLSHQPHQTMPSTHIFIVFLSVILS